MKILKHGIVLYVGGMLGSAATNLPFAVMGGSSIPQLVGELMLWPYRLYEILVLLLT